MKGGVSVLNLTLGGTLRSTLLSPTFRLVHPCLILPRSVMVISLPHLLVSFNRIHEEKANDLANETKRTINQKRNLVRSVLEQALLYQNHLRVLRPPGAISCVTYLFHYRVRSPRGCLRSRRYHCAILTHTYTNTCFHVYAFLLHSTRRRRRPSSLIYNRSFSLPSHYQHIFRVYRAPPISTIAIPLHPRHLTTLGFGPLLFVPTSSLTQRLPRSLDHSLTHTPVIF